MAYNLGAARVATSSTDPMSYWNYYQWWRLKDWHERVLSAITNVQSSTDAPLSPSFIYSRNAPNDWRNPQNDNLWQWSPALNNVCPAWFRLPTLAEWTAEKATWSSQNATWAFNSLLKLPVSGWRFYYDGAPFIVGTDGAYWTSDVYTTYAWAFRFNSSYADFFYNVRAYWFNIRCIQI
jgi:hypothetical protein